MSARLFSFYRLLAWIAAFAFLAGGAAVPRLEATDLSAQGDTSVSAVTHTTDFVAAHTFAAKSPIVFRAWRSVDTHFCTADHIFLRAAQFGRPFSTTIKIADRQFAGAALVGIVELRI